MSRAEASRMGAFLERARLLFRQARYDLAERELLRELDQDPDSSLAHALLGLCRARLQRFDEAIKLGRQAVRLAPHSAYAHYALAYILDDGGQLEEASRAIAGSLALEPLDPEAHALLAYIRARQHRFEESLEAAEQGLRLAPLHVHCLNRRAMALAYMRRPEEAEQVIRTALTQEPHNPVTLANFGWVLLEQHKPAPALEQLHEALRLDPRMAWARQKTIDALVQLIGQGLEGQALKHFPEALRRDPDMDRGRQRMVQALLGQIPEALGRGVEALWLLGCCLTLGGQPQPRLAALLLLLLILNLYVFPRRFVLIAPVSYLVLRLHRLGRRVLAREQVQASSRVGMCLGATLLAGAAAGLTLQPFAILMAVVLQALVLPAAYVYSCPAGGRTRRGLAAYLALLAIGGASLIGLTAADVLAGDLVAEGRDLLFLLGAGMSGLVARALLWWNKEQ